MANLTIRNLDERVKSAIRVRAARHGRSMEEEARQLLSLAIDRPADEGAGLAEAIRRRFAPLGGIDLDPPPRAPGRDPPDFSNWPDPKE